jgi:hypothetical protein
MIGFTVQLNNDEKLHGYVDDFSMIMVDVIEKDGDCECTLRFEGINKADEQWHTWADDVIPPDSKILIEINDGLESSKPIRLRNTDRSEYALNKNLSSSLISRIRSSSCSIVET